LGRALQLLGLHTAELSILFVNSSRMAHLNSRYRGIAGPTDVLSFQMTDSGIGDPSILGDIVICVPKVSSQAKEYGVTFYDELLRLLLHGLLHLIGYDHETSAYQRRRMEKKERELMHAVKTVA
jgi:probable rRNA maturation factor